jgi:predicted DNA-binding WGR domain protein
MPDTRGPKAKDIKLPEPFERFYLFRKDDDRLNSHREYQLICQKSLWEGYVVVRAWGRQGQRHFRSLEHRFEEARRARQFLRKEIARRFRHGYRQLEPMGVKEQSSKD